MSTVPIPPTLDSFLEAPLADIRQVAPATVAYAQGGTRRSAVFAGISPESSDYARWSRRRVVECADVIFRQGTQHILMVALTPQNFVEVGAYRDRLLQAAAFTIGSDEALADYGRYGWRARLVGSEVPELADTRQRLLDHTATDSPYTLWYVVNAQTEDPWQRILDVAAAGEARTRTQVVQALYGEAIPPAGLFLASGKPMLAPSLLPPLLYDRIQAYWLQRPGFHLTQDVWRTILYDYAYTRPTWRLDKQGRAEDASNHQAIWERAPIVGTGRRLGTFWYPNSITVPIDE